MAGLTELITNIGDDNIEFQLLSGSIVRFKRNKKMDDCEVTFASGNDKIDQNKEAIIVWVDKDVFQGELDLLKGKD